MLVEQRSLSALKPYEGNPRRIPKSAVDAVAASIRRYGFQQPIVVDPDGVIIVGHTRYVDMAVARWEAYTSEKAERA